MVATKSVGTRAPPRTAPREAALPWPAANTRSSCSELVSGHLTPSFILTLLRPPLNGERGGLLKCSHVVLKEWRVENHGGIPGPDGGVDGGRARDPTWRLALASARRGAGR